MQTNAMKQALARGETQVGVWITMVRNPAILRLTKSAGLDFARFDKVRASPSMETLSTMALLARALDFTLTVGPPQGGTGAIAAHAFHGGIVSMLLDWYRHPRMMAPLISLNAGPS